MWRAALPCRHVGTALLGSIVAAALVVGASPSSSAAASAAPAGQVWALALPDSVKTVQQKQMSWLAAHGVTTIVAFKRPQASPQAAGSLSEEVTPGRDRTEAGCAPKKACKSRCGLAPDLRGRRHHPGRCGSARASRPRRLRRDPREDASAAPDAPRQPCQAQPDRRDPPAEPESGGPRSLARRYRLRRRRPRTRSRSHVGAGRHRPARHLLSQLPRTRTAAAAGQAAPTSLLVTGRSTTSVTLRWTAAVGGAAGYGVYIDGTFVLNVSAVSITLTGLQCGRSYTFGVDAHDDDGARSGQITTTTSTDACATAGGGGGGGGGGSTDVLPPTAPLGLVKGSSTQTSIAVSWTASSDNVGVAGYGLYRNGSRRRLVDRDRRPRSRVSHAGRRTRSPSTPTTPPGTAPARRRSRQPRAPAPAAATRLPPRRPGALTKTGSTMTSISVSWGASTDNVGVAGYGLYRNGSSTGSSASTSATFSGLACGSSYTLAVDAYDAAGNRSSQRSLTAATSACPPPTDTQAPSVPQGMVFSGQTLTTRRALLERVDRQRRRRGLQALQERRQRHDGRHARLHLHRPHVRDDLHIRDRGLRRSGERLQPHDGHRHGLDQRCAAAPPPPPPPGTGANLWVDTNGGSCARQATPGAWVDSQACSWNAGLPGGPDRRPDPRPRRQLRQRDHRPEQGLDRGARRHLPDRDRRERRRQRPRERAHRRLRRRQQHLLRRPRQRPHLPLRPVEQHRRRRLERRLQRLRQRADLPPRGRQQRHRPQLGGPGQQEQQPDVGQRHQPDLREQQDPRRGPPERFRPRTPSASTPGASPT